LISPNNILAIYLLLLPARFLGCSCHYHSDFTHKEYNDLSHIFVGRISHHYTDSITNKFYTVFEIYESYKGPSNLKSLHVYSPRGGCQFTGKKGTQLMIFLHSHKNEPVVNQCNRKIWIENISEFNIPDWLEPFLHLPDGYVQTSYSWGSIMGEGILINQKPHGKWVYYHKNGNVHSTGLYVNGLKDSVWTDYYYDGITVRQKLTFELDLLNGSGLLFVEDGRLYSEVTYLNDEVHGFSAQYGNSGKYLSYSTYLNGRIIEEFEFYENGKIRAHRSSYINEYWYENGQKSSEEFVSDPSVERSWYQNGNLMFESCRFKNGKTQMGYFAKENGKVLIKNGTGKYKLPGIKGEYQDSLKTGKWRHKYNDYSGYSVSYKNGLSNGVYKKYNDKGMLIVKGEWKDGRPIGVWKYKYNNGRKNRVEKYVDGKETLINSWDPHGNPMVVDGNGVHTYHDFDGVATTRETYRYLDGYRIEE
jgi:antitoxin component YwqK of YwqJK toxin-antitoxin module